MKKQKYNTKQYSVTGSNEFKGPELSRSFVTPFGDVQVYDATKDVTEKDMAQVEYRRLMEDYTLRNAIANRQCEGMRVKWSAIFLAISVSILAWTGVYILLVHVV